MMYSTSLMTMKAVSTETRNTREVARMKKNILKTKLFRMGAISTLKNPLCSRVILSKEKEEVGAPSFCDGAICPICPLDVLYPAFVILI